MSKKIITFFGAEAKVGTTMIAQSFAEGLAAKKQKVLFICASGESHDIYIGDQQLNKPSSIDGLRGLEDITKRDVQNVIASNGKFDIIGGVRALLQAKYFDVKVISKIIDHTYPEYDFIIIDGGHDFQMPLPATSLLNATKRYFVVNGTKRSFDRLHTLQDMILESQQFKTFEQKEEEDMILLNKDDRKENIFSAEQFASGIGMPVVKVPKVNGGYECEVTNQTLMNKPIFANAINTLINDNI